jgi:hypothetical protein
MEPTNRSTKGFCQGGAWRNKLLFQAQAKGSLHKFPAVNGIAIAEQIAGWMAVGKRLGKLLRGPCRRRRIGNIEMQDFAALMRQDQEDIEDAEGGGRDDKKIHRDQIPGMVVEEGLPGLVVASGSGAILANGGIRHCNPEFGQFGLNSFAAPSGIAGPHSPNELDEFAISRGSAAAVTGFPAPEQTKAQTMPGDQSLGLHEHQSPMPVWPQPPEGEPKQTISLAKFRFASLAPEHRELMPKRQIFK